MTTATRLSVSVSDFLQIYAVIFRAQRFNKQQKQYFGLLLIKNF